MGNKLRPYFALFDFRKLTGGCSHFCFHSCSFYGMIQSNCRCHRTFSKRNTGNIDDRRNNKVIQLIMLIQLKSTKDLKEQ